MKLFRIIKRIFLLLLIVSLSLSIMACGPDTYSSSTYKKSSSQSKFTNKYGTPTTKCAHPGCDRYIASSGDTNCCTVHSNRCAQCGKYIDEDALFCMDCILAGISGK